ncbi:MAG: hypothetical protein GX638_08255, partial [Crenarchaeota archaeon]|nr:hypothetical protein [Thermoproteota archaeon]
MIDLTESTSNKKDITEELLARIDRLQKTVDSMIPTKSEKLAVKDDSLFFGLIVSLIVLTIPLPTDDISRFFIPLFDNINPGLSTLIIKTILFVILTISALARYYAAMQLEIEQSKDWRTANKWRYVSLETMLLGLTFILYFAIMGFSGWFLPSKVSSNINTIPIIILVLSTALLVTSDVILIVERIENKVLSFYKIKQLISQDSKQLIPLA